MQVLKAVLGAVVAAILTSTIVVAGDWEQSRDWYVEIKRAAKYARIAIAHTGDLVRIDAEQVVAAKQLQAAAQLPLPERDKAVCTAAAKAVVDFIAAGKAGNMSSGPTSYERQYQRWENLSDECIGAIQQRSGSAR